MFCYQRGYTPETASAVSDVKRLTSKTGCKADCQVWCGIQNGVFTIHFEVSDFILSTWMMLLTAWVPVQAPSFDAHNHAAFGIPVDHDDGASESEQNVKRLDRVTSSLASLTGANLLAQLASLQE